MDRRDAVRLVGFGRGERGLAEVQDGAGEGWLGRSDKRRRTPRTLVRAQRLADGMSVSSPYGIRPPPFDFRCGRTGRARLRAMIGLVGRYLFFLRASFEDARLLAMSRSRQSFPLRMRRGAPGGSWARQPAGAPTAATRYSRNDNAFLHGCCSIVDSGPARRPCYICAFPTVTCSSFLPE